MKKYLSNSFAIWYIGIVWLEIWGGFLWAQPQQEIDSLKQVLQRQVPGDSAFLINQLHLATQFFFLHQFDSAEVYIDSAWSQLPPDQYPELTIYALNRKGILAAELGDIPSSIQHLKEGLRLSEAYEIKKGIKNQYLALGRTYMFLEEWGIASDYYFKGLELAEELGDLEDQYIALHNLSIPFSHSGRSDQSLQYKRKSLQIPGYRPPPVRMIATYMGMADDFKDLAVYDSASIYAEKALDLAKALKHIPFQVRIYSALTNNTIQQELFSQALDYSNTQAALLNPRDSAMLGSHLVNRAYALFGLDRYQQALQVAERACGIAEKSGHLLLLNNVYFQLYTFYRDLNQHQQALLYREKLRTIEDQINFDAKGKELNRLEIVYETQQKEKELAILEQEAARQEMALRNRSLGIWVIGGISLLGIIGAFLYLRNRMLHSQLQRSLTEQRLLRAQMNPYFFFHALSTLERSILKGEDKTTSLHYLSRFAKLMRNILEGSRTEFIPLEEEIENLENYLELQRLRHDFSFAYEIEIDHSVDRENWGIPSMLLQPVVEQAIEGRLLPYKELGKLSLDFQQKEGTLEVTIEDNGGREATGQIHRLSGKDNLPSGTHLVTQRLALLNTQQFKQAGMEVRGLTNAQGVAVGTRVVVQLPVHYLL